MDFLRKLLKINKSKPPVDRFIDDNQRPLRYNDYLPAYTQYTADAKGLEAAIATAAQPDNPLTFQLQDIYNNIYLDATVHNAVQIRIKTVLGKKFCFYTKEGKKDEKLTDAINTQWFIDVVSYILESNYFGYSLLGFNGQVGKIKEVINVDRRLVVPDTEQGAVLYNTYEESDGLLIADYPANFLLAELERRENYYGLFQKVAYQIFRLRSSINIRQLAIERYVLPALHIKAEGHGENSLKYNDAAAQFGSSGVIVTPEKDEVNVLTSRGTDHDAFQTAIDYQEKCITKIILGQVMTTEDGSSRSQAEVHKKVQDELIYSDCVQLLKYINNKLLPFMRLVGYNISEGHYIDIDKSDSRDEILADVIELKKAGFNVDAKFVEDKIGIKINEDIVMPSVNGTSVSKEKDLTNDN